MVFLKYILIILTLTSICYTAKGEEEGKNLIAYTEIYGPMESFIAPNLELVILDEFDGIFSKSSLSIRAGVNLIGLDFFVRQQRYLGGLHYIIGDKHKVDLGVNYLYQKFEKGYIFKTDNFISFNIGYRNYIDESILVGFALNPTFSKKNKPFWPASLKFGFVIF